MVEIRPWEPPRPLAEWLRANPGRRWLELVAIATDQDGAVSRDQLRSIAFSDGAIGYMVKRKVLHRVHREVYALGHSTLTPRGRRFAAVLAGGVGALLSHISACMNYRVLSSDRARFDVTVMKERTSTKAIQFHASRTILERDRAEHDGIPCTSLARTLLDVAEQTRSVRTVEKAINQAHIEHLYDHRAVEDVIERAHGRRGLPIFAAAVDLYQSHGPTPTKSDLEDAMLAICRNADVLLPIVNAVVLGRERDFVWHAQGLVVEVDGYETHSTPWAFRDDRRRDVELQVAGYSVLRFTWQDVIYEPERVAAALAAWFASAGAAMRRTASAR